MIDIYTDGSCLKYTGHSRGRGGWAFILIEKDTTWEICGNEENSTNNRTELLAVVNALKFVGKETDINLYSDSQYVIIGIEVWLNKWFTKRRKNPNIKNFELWVELYNMIKDKNIRCNWIKSHSGNIYNERVDELAKKEAKKLNI